MGSGSSVPSRAEFIKETRFGSDLVSRILQWLLKESNLIDLYALAAPSECRKYVVFTSQGIQKLFKELQIQPKRDSSGKIYFQRIADLSRMPERTGQEQQETCMQISFFFIRILQIFAALTLSVIDTEIPISDQEMNSYSVAASQATRVQVPLEQFRRVPLFAAPQQRGGVLQPGKPYYIKDANYSILNRYLEKISDTYFELYDGDAKTGLLVPFDRIYPTTQPTLLYKGKDTNGNAVSIQARLTIQRSQKSVDEVVYKVLLKPVKRDGKDIERYAVDAIHREKGQIGPVDFHSVLGEEPLFNRQTIARFIKNEFFRILGKPIEGYEDGVGFDRAKARKFETIPFSEMPSQFQLKSVWESISSKPPVKAYCVARAMQLLSPEGIYGSQGEGRVSICDKKFAFFRQGSLPKAQGSILESRGILSLNLLFYDMLDKSIPSISKETQEKYQNFLKELKVVYEELDTLPSETVDSKKIIDTFHSVCVKNGKQVEGAMITKDKQMITGLRTYVGQLLYRQMKHTKDVTRILGKLFVINESEPLLLQPSIQKGGLAEVERIAEEARELLVNYYKDCEITYRQGVLFAAKKQTSLEPRV